MTEEPGGRRGMMQAAGMVPTSARVMDEMG